MTEYFDPESPEVMREDIDSIAKINQKLSNLIPVNYKMQHVADNKHPLDLSLKANSQKPRAASRTEKNNFSLSDNNLGKSEKKNANSVDKNLLSKILKNIKVLKDNSRKTSHDKIVTSNLNQKSVRADNKKPVENEKSHRKEHKSVFSSKFAEAINKMSQDMKLPNRIDLLDDRARGKPLTPLIESSNCNFRKIK